MIPRIDVMGKIQQLYMAKRPVPYLSFMHVFNELLADSAKVVPKTPGKELKEDFRAVCMCINVGILDTEGREDERIREFQEKVYPVWAAALPRQEMAKYDEILRGKLREAQAPGGSGKEAAAVEEAAARSRELMHKLGLVEVETERPGAVPTAQEPAGKKSAAQVFDSVDYLCQAIRAGDLKVAYAPRGQEGELARYRLAGLEVAVKLAQASGIRYVILVAAIGRSQILNARERVDNAAAEMGYARMADYAYMRRGEGFACTLSVGPSASNVACAATDTAAEDDISRQIAVLHRDLGELVERLH